MAVKHQKVDNRGRYYKLLPIGKRALNWDEETYRFFLKEHGAKEVKGKFSATTMDIGQLSQALEVMKKKGFKPQKKSSVSNISDWRKKRINKITAMWIALFEAGVIRDRSEKAMISWTATITKKARLEWASSEDLNACIEGLKTWSARERVALRK